MRNLREAHAAKIRPKTGFAGREYGYGSRLAPAASRGDSHSLSTLLYFLSSASVTGNRGEDAGRRLAETAESVYEAIGDDDLLASSPDPRAGFSELA